MNTQPPAIEFLRRELECGATGGNPSSGYTYMDVQAEIFSNSD